MIILAKQQLRVLSNFFSDIAKGLFLGAAANQFIPLSGSLGIRLLNSIIVSLMAMILLYIALHFAKPKEKI